MFKGRLNLLLKLNLFMLMLLFNEFSDCVHSSSARIELVAPTDEPTVSWCLTLHDLIPWYTMERAWRNLHSLLRITADSCPQVYSHYQPTPRSGLYKYFRNYVLSLAPAHVPILVLFKLPGNGLRGVCQSQISRAVVSQLSCLRALWVHLHCPSAVQGNSSLQELLQPSPTCGHPCTQQQQVRKCSGLVVFFVGSALVSSVTIQLCFQPLIFEKEKVEYSVHGVGIITGHVWFW